MTYTYELVMPDGVVFQSTYRSRGMTTLEFACVQLLLISIHIPLARYDEQHGLKQDNVAISIYILLARYDWPFPS